MAPAIPHVCEEFFSKIKDESDEEFVSIAEFTTDLKQFSDKESEDIENIAQELVSNIARFKGNKNLAKLSKVEITQATDNKFKLFDAIKSLLSETKDIKTIFGKLNESFASDSKFIQKFVPKTLGTGLTNYLPKVDETEFLNSILPFLEKEFDCPVTLTLNADKAKQGTPGKPAVLLE